MCVCVCVLGEGDPADIDSISIMFMRQRARELVARSCQVHKIQCVTYPYNGPLYVLVFQSSTQLIITLDETVPLHGNKRTFIEARNSLHSNNLPLSKQLPLDLTSATSAGMSVAKQQLGELLEIWKTTRYSPEPIGQKLC